MGTQLIYQNKLEKMTAQELSASTCYATAGTGVKFTWLLEGSTTAYVDATGVTIATDGYKITAGLTWKTLSNSTSFNTGATLSNETPADADDMAIGGCVETLTSTSVALATGVATEGNFAICHWLFFDAVAGNTPVLNLAAVTSAYGTTRYLNETQWGTNGGAVTGAGMISSSGGTELTATTNGLTYDPVPSATFTAYVDATIYKMWWYQPKYASSYAAGTLRRYNGGSTDGSKVKGYCVSQRLAKSTASTHIAGGFSAGSTVTLAGASAIAAGAIALGAAALAF